MQKKFQKILHYRNIKVIARFKIDFPNSIMNPHEAFSELMKYIYLCHIHALEKELNPKNPLFKFNCVIHSEMSDIDNMWHTFLLFTKDYYEFCQNYLSGFFHHEPLDLENNFFNEDNYETELTRYLSYIENKLGEPTLRKWFQTE